MKSIGRWYNAFLKDKAQVDQLRKEVASGLDNIDKTLLPGKLKLWCMQYGLLPRLIWPLTLYEVPLSKVEKLERLVSSYARKWLGLPRCLSSIGLYGKGMLDLPISSLSEEYKCAKVRLEMMLLDSSDPVVAQAALSWPPGGSGPHGLQLSRQRQHSDTGTSWAKCRRGEVVLALGPAHHPGARPLHLRDTSWCSRRYIGKRKVRTSCGASKTRAVDGMGRNREGEDLLARAVGNGGIQGEFYHQGCLWCPTFSHKPKPVVWWRPHMPSVSKYSIAEAHPSGLQDQPHSRPLHLVAQPGLKESCSSARESADKRERPSSPVIPLAGNIICPRGWGSSQPHLCRTGCWSAKWGTGLEAAGRLGPETLLPSWDCVYQPATRPCYVVSLHQACLHHWAHSALGEFSGGGLWAEEAEVRWACSRCAATGLESEGMPGRSREDLVEAAVDL